MNLNSKLPITQDVFFSKLIYAERKIPHGRFSKRMGNDNLAIATQLNTTAK